MSDTVRVDGVTLPDSGDGSWDRISLRVIKEAFDGNIGTGGVSIRAVAPQDVSGHREIVVKYDGGGPDEATIVDGFLGTLEDSRNSEALTVYQNYAIQDRNLRLAHRNVNRWKRPAESDVKRLKAAMAKFAPGVSTGLYVPWTNTVTLPAERYEDTSLDEVLQDCLDSTGKTWFVDDDDELHYHRLNEDVGFNSALEVTDTAPDGVTQQAPERPRYTKDPYELANKLRVYSDKKAKTVKDATSITAHDADGARHQDQLSYPKDDTGLSLTGYANAILAERKLERETWSFTLRNVRDPSAVQAGQRIKITSTVLGLTAAWKRISRITWTTPAPGVWNADLECGHPRRRAMARRRKKPKKTKPKNIDSINADTDPYTISSFDDTVAPPTLADGAAVGWSIAGQMRAGQYAGETQTPYGPAWHALAVGMVMSALGQWYNGHTSRPSFTSCAGLDNAFTGHKVQEQWYKATVSAPPADAAGIELTITAGSAGGVQGPGYGEVAPLEIVALGSQPSAMKEGYKIGEVMAGGTVTVTFPSGSVPAGGGDIYLGVRTSWESTAVGRPDAYSCGWTWPFMGHEHNLDDEGTPYQGYSGQVRINTPVSSKWLVWDSSAVDWGTTQTSAENDSPYDGGNQLVETVVEGSPTAGMSGGCIYVTATAPAGKGWSLYGEEEDEDEPAGPWSEFGWACEVTFSMDAVGSPTEAGTREIEITTVGSARKATMRVHLGDVGRAAGVSVEGPSATDYAAKTLAAGTVYRAIVDTRSGKVRAKVWANSAKKPAKWDVEADLTDTDDDGDNVTIVIRAGNTATEQTVRVCELIGYATAQDGSQVVNEFIGVSDGKAAVFRTHHKYRRGTLRLYANGVAVPPKKQWPSQAKAKVAKAPTTGMFIRARYVAREAI